MAIFEKQGVYWIDYYFRGKRIREKVGHSKTLAKQAFAKRKAEIAEAKFFPDRKKSSITFKEFAGTFWKLYGQYKRWVSLPYMHKRVTEEFGARHLDEMTVPVAMDFLNKIRESTSVTNSNRYHSLLRCMFNRAIDWGTFEGTNPFSKIKQGREPQHRLRFLDKGEIAALFKVCPSRIYPIVACAVFTGLRRGEILGLTWNDINLEQDVLYVLETKSGKPREIPISPKLHAVLEQLTPGPKHSKVFQVSEDVLHKDFAAALVAAKIREFRFHDLRHTFASHFVMRTNDLPTLQKILGHHSPAMTQRYAHLSKNHMQVGMMTFDAGMDTIWTPRRTPMGYPVIKESSKVLDNQALERCVSG